MSSDSKQNDQENKPIIDKTNDPIPVPIDVDSTTKPPADTSKNDQSGSKNAVKGSGQSLITKFWTFNTGKPNYQYLFEKEEAERKKRQEEAERKRQEGKIFRDHLHSRLIFLFIQLKCSNSAVI